MEEKRPDRTLCIIRRVGICKIPPRTTAEGHCAGNWDRTLKWSGRLRVVEQGEQCVIRLEETGDKEGQLFASIPVPKDKDQPPVVEPVTDSQRWFVLRLTDGKGQRALVGLGFDTREDSFEFKVALSDQSRQTKTLPDLPPRDYTLKEGTTIKINLKGKKPPTNDNKSFDGSAGGFRLDAPPEPGTKMAPAEGKKKKKSHHKKKEQGSGSEDESKEKDKSSKKKDKEKSGKKADDEDWDWADFEKASPEKSGKDKDDKGKEKDKKSDKPAHEDFLNL